MFAPPCLEETEAQEMLLSCIEEPELRLDPAGLTPYPTSLQPSLLGQKERRGLG